MKRSSGPKGKSGLNEEIKKVSKEILSAEKLDEETREQRAKTERDMEEKLRTKKLDR